MPKASAISPGLMRCVVACCLGFAILVGVGVYMFSAGVANKPVHQPSKKSGLIGEVSPVITPVKTNAVQSVKKKVISPEEQKKLCPGDEGWDPSAHPFVLVPTNRKEVVEDKHPVARNATEQILHWICSVEVGDPPVLCPDLPAMELENINKILDEPPDFQYDESLDRLEAKRAIEMAKKELKDYIAKGGDPHEFFKYYHMQLMNYFQERTLAQQSVVKMIKEDPDLAKEYLEQVNGRLAERGIKQITLSPKMRARLGIEERSESFDGK